MILGSPTKVKKSLTKPLAGVLYSLTNGRSRKRKQQTKVLLLPFFCPLPTILLKPKEKESC